MADLRNDIPVAGSAGADDDSIPLDRDPGPASAFSWSLWVLYTHLPLVALAALAALSRAIQLGWTRDHSTFAFWALEFVVEPARVFVVVGALGAGNISRGKTLVISWWKKHRSRPPQKRKGDDASTRASLPWRQILEQVFVFAVAALGTNVLIGWASGPGLLHALVAALFSCDDETAGLVIELFLKNLTVIPVMACFYVALVRLVRRSGRDGDRTS